MGTAAMKKSKFMENFYVILSIAYLLFPIRWAAWMYNFYVLCQMLYHWGDILYIGKFILVWSLTMAWILTVMFTTDGMGVKK